MQSNKIYFAIKNGLINVINHEIYLNESNFFPVADADTGTNLKMSFFPLLELFDNFDESNFNREVLSNASGNSGLIFGAYLLSLISSLSKGNELKKCFTLASKNAYESLSDPREGTILTAMKLFGEMFVDIHKIETIVDYLQLEKMNITRSLKENAKNIDSGISAFIYFIIGIDEYYKGNEHVVKTSLESSIHFIHGENEYVNFRYCVQIVVKEYGDLKQLMNGFKHDFDSLVTFSNDNLQVMHLHTNDVNKFFDFIDKHVTIVKSKVQDMLQEFNLKDAKSDSVVIYDSIGDTNSEDIMLNNFCIYMPVIIDNVVYQDRLNFSNEYLLEKIKSGSKFSSSQPSIESIVSLLQRVYSFGYKKVIFVSVSKQMSGTYNKIKYATKFFHQQNPNLEVYIVNSGLNSSGQGLFTTELSNDIYLRSHLEEVLMDYRENRSKFNILVNVSDLELMYLSGRLKKHLYKIVKALRLGAIVTISNGLGKIKKPIFKNSNEIKNLLKLIKNKDIKKFILSYTTNKDKAEEFANILKNIYPSSEIRVYPTSNIIAGFAGSKALSMGYLEVGDD